MTTMGGERLGDRIAPARNPPRTEDVRHRKPRRGRRFRRRQSRCQLAAHGHGAAALLLPAYYVADATLTLGLRMWRRERFWAAHRSHSYQRATDNGFTASAVIRRTPLLNTALALLALLTIRVPSPALAALALLAGALAVGLTLRSFARRRATP